MALSLRPIGVYALAGSALFSQTKTAHHVEKMKTLASDGAALALLADAELARSTELQGKAAADAEGGSEIQSEAAELEAAAEEELSKAAAETALGDEYAERAEALHEQSARDAAESEAAEHDAEEAALRSEQLHEQAENDRAAAALDKERSIAILEEATKAEEAALAADKKAAEYEAIAMKKEGASVRDGEALMRTEAGALEDAEMMASCAPIPLIDFFCEAVGAAIESGYQAVAAFDGTKVAVETISAGSAQRKGQKAIALAMEKQEEASRLSLEAEEYEGLYEEESEKIATEEAESETLSVRAGDAHLLSEEKMRESEKEETLAALDEGKAAEQYAKAAEDEVIASEEESSAAAIEVKAEELLSQSASEEVESIAERADGTAKEANADRLMKVSVDHGIRALGFVIHATATACLVVYVVVMRLLTKVIIPGVGRGMSGDPPKIVAKIFHGSYVLVMHALIVVGSVALLPTISRFEDMSPPLRIRSLFCLALLAGLIESLGVHSTHTACHSHRRGLGFGPGLATTAKVFLSKVMHLIPRVLLEALIVVTMLGPGVFETYYAFVKPELIWGTLALMAAIFIIFTASKAGDDSTNSPVDEIAVGGRETESLCSNADQEYGSMESISLSPKSSSSPLKEPNARNCFAKCNDTMCDYFGGLRLYFDLLAITLVSVLLWHCSPLLKILYPLAATSTKTISSLASMPILMVFGVIVAVIVHFLFVH